MSQRPIDPVVLYQYEGCPMCFRVRLALEDLDLATEVRPCPRGGTRFRPEAVALSGKAQFPFLVDPNTGTSLLESTDIVAYLYAAYGDGQPPAHLFGWRMFLAWRWPDPERAERAALSLAEEPYLWEPGAGRRTVLSAAAA